MLLLALAMLVQAAGASAGAGHMAGIGAEHHAGTDGHGWAAGHSGAAGDHRAAEHHGAARHGGHNGHAPRADGRPDASTALHDAPSPEIPPPAHGHDQAPPLPGHCHPGIDCFLLAALPAGPLLLPQPLGLRIARRHAVVLRPGLPPGFELPPPRARP